MSARQIMNRHIVSGALGLIGLGLSGLLGYQIHRGTQPVAPPQTKAAVVALDTALLPAFTLPPVDISYPEIVDRPLFIPTRRPPPPPNNAPVVTMRRGQFKLVGVSVNQDLSMAFLQEISTGKSKGVAKGTEINGMIVDTVEPSRVVLRQGEETEELSLKVAASPRLPAGPVAGATTPGAPAPAAPVPPGTINQPPNTPPPNIQPLPPQTLPPGFIAGPQGITTPPPVAAPATPTLQPKSPAELGTQSPAVDPNAATPRRRRFQNLPQ
ncbi:MAG: hypothetical protein JNM52_00500 [Betaproteobacteria bacterium]|nr:hypothetical protein [Betaproteobacteria bacterium]